MVVHNNKAASPFSLLPDRCVRLNETDMHYNIHDNASSHFPCHNSLLNANVLVVQLVVRRTIEIKTKLLGSETAAKGLTS